jgi:Asp-tRNA(Asn)/Glu-tRNA(Gln) amidotransferase A subunit family amidase
MSISRIGDSTVMLVDDAPSWGMLGPLISPVEVVQSSLSRIDKLNPKLNAIITVLKGRSYRPNGR